jgi:hypothetical protein
MKAVVYPIMVSCCGVLSFSISSPLEREEEKK